MDAAVLYIEDNPDNLALVQRVVESLGCAFFGASNGQEGLRLASGLKPDVILLDINLPDLDGYAVARQLRSCGDAHLLYVPLVGISANAMRGEVVKALEAGCDVYMTKPLKILDLRARIESFLEILKG